MKRHGKIQVPHSKSHVAIINYIFSLGDIRINVKLPRLDLEALREQKL